MKRKRLSIIRILLHDHSDGYWCGVVFMRKNLSFGKTSGKLSNRNNNSCKNYHMENYENLIKAIILTESKGKGTDLMQSSESLHGEAEIIDNPADSIDQGVKYLAEMIVEAKKQGCDLWTAVQAYNFGKDYIAYVKIMAEKTQ